MHRNSPCCAEFRDLRISSCRNPQTDELSYPAFTTCLMDRKAGGWRLLFCPASKCCRRIALSAAWGKVYLRKIPNMCWPPKAPPHLRCVFLKKLIMTARCQFSQIHRNAVTDTRIWPRAGFDPKPTKINGSLPDEVHIGFTHLHAVLLNAAEDHRIIETSNLKLEGIHKDHQVQIPTPCRTT